MDFIKPEDIEKESMRIIENELAARGITIPEERRAIVMRTIHTTADFDFAKVLRFTDNAVSDAVSALRGGVIVTDTNMVRAGISKPAAEKLHCAVRCHMADEDVAAEAKRRGVTRATVSVERTFRDCPHAIFAVGNAPTALLKIAECVEAGARPAMVIGVPVGFVNVVESKERALAACERHGVPAIIAMGRKGGSTVAAAICNALLYTAAGLLEPESRQ